MKISSKKIVETRYVIGDDQEFDVTNRWVEWYMSCPKTEKEIREEISSLIEEEGPFRPIKLRITVEEVPLEAQSDAS